MYPIFSDYRVNPLSFIFNHLGQITLRMHIYTTIRIVSLYPVILVQYSVIDIEITEDRTLTT